MRKFSLTLVAAAAAFSASALPSQAGGIPSATFGNPIVDAVYRPSIDGTPMLDQVRMVCTHFYNGRWHHRQHCYWVPDRHRRHGQHRWYR